MPNMFTVGVNGSTPNPNMLRTITKCVANDLCGLELWAFDDCGKQGLVEAHI